MVQQRLFEVSEERTAGAFDLEVAAYAFTSTLEGQAGIVVHYDEDYDHLHSVEPRLLTRWVVPRGSVD